MQNRNGMRRLIRKGLKGLLSRLARGLVKYPRLTRALVKAYKETGTGLSNPYIRRKLSESLRDPELSALFMDLYLTGSPNLSIELMLELNKMFKSLLLRYPSIDLRSDWDSYNLPYGLDGAIQKYGLLTILRYNDQLKLILDKDGRLYDLVKESPLYTFLVYNDIIKGKANDVPSYVASLVKLGNTFMRRMQPRNNLLLTNEDFLTIRNGSMDVGSPAVVNEPSMRYGSLTYIYMPRFESDLWNMRFPIFRNGDILLKTDGMHTGDVGLSVLGSTNIPWRLQLIISKYMQSNGVPRRYTPTGDNYTHMVFTVPYKDPVSISDLYIAFPATDENILKFKPIFGRGLKKGGKL